MKADLKDSTFIVIVKLDSIQRLENILVVIQQINRCFNTNILIVEVSDQCNGILKTLLPRKVEYHFLEDKDNIFYRTKYFNHFISFIRTPIVAFWDSDVVIDKNAIIESVEKIRQNKADVVYPYNGIFLETSTIIRNHYLKTKDICFLYRNINKLDYLYNQQMVGGAIFANKEKYIEAGGENEKHYGWGNDDFDRYYRFKGLGYKIYRVNKPLFHLTHPRGDNSKYRSSLSMHISCIEKNKIENSSKEELIHHIKTDNSFLNNM